MYLRVRAVPRSFDAEHVKIVGENIFCDAWDVSAHMRGEDTCSAWPEIELAVLTWGGKTIQTIRLCREHAGYIATQITEAIEMCDGADILRTKKEAGHG